MDHDQHNENNKPVRVYRSRFARFMDRQGVFIVLGACLLIIAGALFIVGTEDRTEFVREDGEEAASTVKYLGEYGFDGDYYRTDAPEENALTTAAETAPVFDAGESVRKKAAENTVKPPDTGKSEPTADEMLKTMCSPIDGEIGMVFAMDRLVYHRTLEQWMVHGGTDLYALAGSEVKACLAGTVESVEKDAMMGYTVTVQHPCGIKTVYSSLLEDGLAKAGDKLEKGQTLGLTGNTAVKEHLEGAHVHFEVWKDGRPVDPMQYLPAAAE